MEALWEQVQELGSGVAEIWAAGGWCMFPIALTSLVLFGLGVHIYLNLRDKGYRAVREDIWREWIENPEQRRGRLGLMLDFTTAAKSLKDMGSLFQELRGHETSAFERDLRVMKVCIGAAPLLGLLGTVTGMFATFAALASGTGGDQTMELVAKGISEALITTETGLVVALPGVFFHYQLKRKYANYRLFLAHLETVCTQSLYRRMKAAS